MSDPRRCCLFGLLLLGLLATAPLEAEPSSAGAGSPPCPDLSGTWRYPGRVGLDAACSPRWPARKDMPLPGPGGYYLSGIDPHPMTLRQEGCRSLVIETRLGMSLDNQAEWPDEPKTLVLDLSPARERKVEWRDGGLVWRRKYTPSGVRWPPWRKEWMELRLRVLPEGGLEYHLQQEHGGKVLGEITCRLERWAGE
ncbi:MAG TPA: hypothetical protein VF017_23755 [Thermoanaerobaculia bacterium]|nr:hypothetical protein [Thermoanaerobaculia bacterium]